MVPIDMTEYMNSDPELAKWMSQRIGDLHTEFLSIRDRKKDGTTMPTRIIKSSPQVKAAKLLNEAHELIQLAEDHEKTPAHHAKTCKAAREHLKAVYQHVISEVRQSQENIGDALTPPAPGKTVATNQISDPPTNREEIGNAANVPGIGTSDTNHPRAIDNHDLVIVRKAGSLLADMIAAPDMPREPKTHLRDASGSLAKLERIAANPGISGDPNPGVSADANPGVGKSAEIEEAELKALFGDKSIDQIADELLDEMQSRIRAARDEENRVTQGYYRQSDENTEMIRRKAKTLTKTHEAGHAILASFAGLKVDRVQVAGSEGPYVSYRAAHIDPPRAHWCAVRLAGLAAEKHYDPRCATTAKEYLADSPNRPEGNDVLKVMEFGLNFAAIEKAIGELATVFELKPVAYAMNHLADKLRERELKAVDHVDGWTAHEAMSHGLRVASDETGMSFGELTALVRSEMTSAIQRAEHAAA